MATTADVDYGPLELLIGKWTGDKGTDVAPEPDETAVSPYYETITMTPAGTVDNAAEQDLVIVHYHLLVHRKSNDEIFHNQTGYWLWVPDTETVMHSFTIPRAMGVVAGGTWSGPDADGRITLKVAAGDRNPGWDIMQQPFMKEKARTTGFEMTLTVSATEMAYRETTYLDIYGGPFEHTDENVLVRA